MRAQQFIDKLAEGGLLSESVLNRLREKVEGSVKPPNVNALAQFLVDKGHLTREQADQALEAVAPKSQILKKKDLEDEDKAKKKKRLKQRERETTDEALGKQSSKKAPDKKNTRKAKKYTKRKKGDNEFDTPLMLLGGGGLVLLVLCGVGIVYLLFSESGDERLDAARTAFEAGSYTQAIQDYEIFLEKFAGHEGESLARVTLGVARIRAIPESNSELRLKEAQSAIPRIEDEEEFPAIQEELASLLPAIAKGLSERADDATELEEIRKYVGLTREAMVLCANSKYVQSRLRDQRELDQIEQTLIRIDRRQVALEDLEATIEKMQAAVAAGDTRTAYAEHAVFVKAHAEKATDEELVAAVAATSQAEKEGVHYVEERVESLTNEARSPVQATVAMADPRKKAEAPTDGVAVVQFQGAAYALNRRSGELLWRRPVDVSLRQIEPLLLGKDCLLVDAREQELVRVNATTGNLVWRTPLEDAVAQPTLLRSAGEPDRVLLAGESGRLHVVDAASGARLGYVQFAQSLRSAPAVFSERGRIFLVGEHSSVYSLDAADFGCLGVFYLGHAKGTVVTPPVIVLNRVLVVENDGASTSNLHIFGLDDANVIDRELAAKESGDSRLAGLVTRVPEVFGKRFAVMTDSGFIGVYEASAEDDQSPITRLATRDSRRRIRSTRYTAVVNRELWVAGSGLARYSIQPSGNRLPVNDIEEPFRGDTFVHPLRVADGVVIHMRRRRGRVGATVAATDANDGSVYWETDIAAPAAGPPVTVGPRGATRMLFATSNGRLFEVSSAAMRSGVAATVVQASDLPESQRLDVGTAQGNRAMYVSLKSGAAIGVAPDEGQAALQSLLLPSGLSHRPLPFADGWLAGLAVGQVWLFDSDGVPIAAPFQPELAPHSRINWHEPALGHLGGGEPAVFISDGGKNLYAIQLVKSPAPHLAPMAEHVLDEGNFVSRVAIAGDRVAAATPDQLMLFETETLKPTGGLALTSPLVWGPFALNDRLLFATADNQLLAIEPANPDAPLWAEAVDAQQLTGAPQLEKDRFLISHRRGVMQLRSLTTGELIEQFDLGQAVADSPTRVGARMTVAAFDGALLVVEPPQARR